MRPELKVLFITGYVHDAVAWQDQLEPGMQLLTKPFTMEELTLRIKRVITGRVAV